MMEGFSGHRDMEGMPIMSLFSKDLSLFEMLEGQAVSANQAAQELLALCQDFAHVNEHAAVIAGIEQEADGLIHRLIRQVDSTFVTPLDKEDLHLLSKELDDITDAIESAASRFVIYRFEAPLPGLQSIIELMVQLTQAVCEAVNSLRDRNQRDHADPALSKIHGLIREFEQGFRQALSDLFNAPDPDPLTVLKWKDVYERLERTPDNCEEVANVIEGILVKYA